MTHMDDDAVERLERAAHWDEAKAITVRATDLRALLSSYKAMREALAGFANALDDGDFSLVGYELNQRICCDGHMCGCQGSTIGQYLAHELREAVNPLLTQARAALSPNSGESVG